MFSKMFLLWNPGFGNRCDFFHPELKMQYVTWTRTIDCFTKFSKAALLSIGAWMIIRTNQNPIKNVKLPVFLRQILVKA